MISWIITLIYDMDFNLVIFIVVQLLVIIATTMIGLLLIQDNFNLRQLCLLVEDTQKKIRRHDIDWLRVILFAL